MRNPFRRTQPRDPQVEQAVRHSLADHARHAPAGHEVADRVLAAVDRTPARDPRRDSSRWRTWAFPLIAAGAVAAVVGAVAGIQQLDKPSAHGTAAASPSVPRVSVSNASPSVAVSPTTHAPSVHTSPTTTTTAPVDTSTLHGVKILDLTFADVDDGWALATADCINGPGRCPALLRTHNGQTWHSSPRVGFNVVGQTSTPCDDPCVEHIRFATDRIGYAYGPTSFLMTTDGGRHWGEQSGGADAVETLNQNVIRVTSQGTGCPGPCDVRVFTAPIGGSTWTRATLPGTEPGFGFQFARGGDDAYLLFFGHVAGGEPSAESVLYHSADNGVTWTRGGEPCPQTGSVEIDSRVIAAGDQGRAAVLCAPRTSTSNAWVATSTDGGAHFTAQPGKAPAANLLTGDPATVLVNTGVGGLARSTDGGKTWSPVRYPIRGVSFAGFENTQVGRIVAAHGTEIWTTRDGGQSWTELTLQ
jgi:photosystem II stability/assembly factor-like uncharacterized protein